MLPVLQEKGVGEGARARDYARKAGDILKELGYDLETIQRVQELNLKKNFPSDPESRVLEDALCLVFLQHQFADLAARTTEDNVINAKQRFFRVRVP